MLDQTYSSSFEVQQIVDEKIIDGETHFLVKWIGYEHSENTWEPLRHMANSKDKIKQWENYKIAQIKLASDKKLHEELRPWSDKNRISPRNSSNFKRISNPYKKVYLQIDDQEDQKSGGFSEEKPKIQSIFDQPEMKKLIKNKKTERKKKELQMFEKRLKTRPKIWEKYLENEDQVIKRANQKIKEVIDKAYGRNLELNNEKTEKQIKKSIIPQEIQEKTQKIKVQSKKLNPTFQEAKSGQEHKKTNQAQNVQSLQSKVASKKSKEKRTIFSSSEEEQDQTIQNHDKQKAAKIKTFSQQNHKQQIDKFNNNEASMEQETNFISIKQKKQSFKEVFRGKKQSSQNLKLSQSCESKRVNDMESKEIDYQKTRKLSVSELLKGIVEEKKHKKQTENMDKKIGKNTILNIKPETILLSEIMIRKMKENQPMPGRNNYFCGKRAWMSRISQQSQKNSCFSKVSSVSLNGMEKNNLLPQLYQKNAQEKQQINEKNVHQLSQNLTTPQETPLKPSPPFECSRSSINSVENRSSELISINHDTYLNMLLKPQDQDKIQSQNLSQFFVPSFSDQRSKQDQQEDEQSSSESSIKNQEQASQRVINYSTFTNYVSTALPEGSSQTQNTNRIGQIRILNLLRQQSMSTRASERTQLPQNLTQQNSINRPSQSVVYELNQMQEILQSEQQQILKTFPHQQQSQRVLQHSLKNQSDNLEPFQNSNKQESLIEDEVLDYFLQLNNQRKTHIYQPQQSKIAQFNWIEEKTDQRMKKVEIKEQDCFVELSNINSKQEVGTQSLILKYDFSSASK